MSENGDFEPKSTAPAGLSSPIGRALQAALATSVDALVSADARLRLNDDPEPVHCARVAVRRLRSHLRTFLPVLDRPWACELRARLSRLQDRLAPVRDLDVLAESLARLAAELPAHDSENASKLVDAVRLQRKNAHMALQTALRTPEYASLLDELVRAAAQPRFTGRVERTAREAAPKLIRRAAKRARKAVRRASDPPSNRDLHRIRIRAKHVRYAAEALTDALGSRARKVARAAEALQTLLGEQHDGVVIAAYLRSAGATPDAIFTAGQLAMLATRSSRKARAKWRRRWKALNKLIN